MTNSKVYLIGFGPGDPELMTIKAHKILKKADIIFYDDLINKNILKEYSAEKIYVGKRRGNHSKNQDEINKLLYESAKNPSYNLIVRLKGGDPSIFGRVGEELDYLIDKGVDVEVIPGISSAQSAAASIRLPLTQRFISSSVAFCSGHHKNKIIVPQTGTLVYYMCAKNALHIFSEIIKKGWSENTPVALIHKSSFEEEKIRISTLKKELLRAGEYLSPLIIIVGKVIGLSFVKNK